MKQVDIIQWIEEQFEISAQKVQETKEELGKENRLSGEHTRFYNHYLDDLDETVTTLNGVYPCKE